MSRASRSAQEIAFEIYEKPLDPAEFERRVAEILGDEDEKRNIADLIAWFTRRYPTAESRLRYVRKHRSKRT